MGTYLCNTTQRRNNLCYFLRWKIIIFSEKLIHLYVFLYCWNTRGLDESAMVYLELDLSHLPEKDSRQKKEVMCHRPFGRNGIK